MSPHQQATRRWPAEWEPHSACLVLWPHNRGTFRLESARAEYGHLIQKLGECCGEDVIVLCLSRSSQEAVSQFFSDTTSSRGTRTVRTVMCPSNDSWVRDTGPTCVVATDDEGVHLLGLDWGFNAYGGPEDGCYWPCDLDRGIAKIICQQALQCSVESHPQFVLEGGSVHTDGEGTILTTKECLLNTNRNPNMSQLEIEETILRATGCSKIIWLDTGLAGDEDTNGHIDNFCCFVAPGIVVLAWTDDDETDQENYRRCRHAMTILESSQDAQGRSLTVHKLHLPKPMYYSSSEIESLQFGAAPMTTEGTATDETIVFPRTAGERMAGSYVNFYIANTGVLVPQFGDVERDAQAIDTLQGLFFPSRRVMGIPSREILIGGGNIHCVTQQVPKVEFVSNEQSDHE